MFVGWFIYLFVKGNSVITILLFQILVLPLWHSGTFSVQDLSVARFVRKLSFDWERMSNPRPNPNLDI